MECAGRKIFNGVTKLALESAPALSSFHTSGGVE
jgi:hypothetical protein